LSLENDKSGCRSFPVCEKAILAAATDRESTPGPAWSQTPSTSRNNMHENRETSRMSRSPVGRDRLAKAISRTANAYVLEESDCAVLPMSLPNNERQLWAEVGEERAWPKEKFHGA
jgi:hypothetical protein